MITNKISSHIGNFAMAATDISRLSPDGIMQSYDVTAGRTYHAELGAPSMAPGMHNA